MSREDLKNFFHSIEHSSELRLKAKKCEENIDVLKLAKEYGFNLTIEDLNEDEIAEKTNNWFKASKLAPLRNKQQI